MALVDDEAGIEVAALEEVVEPVAPAIELGDVAGGEVHPRRIEHLQVAVVDLGRAFIVQRRLVVVVPLEQFHDVEAGDDLLAVRLQAVPGILALPTETAVEANSGSELAPRRSNRAVRGRKRFMLIRLIAE